MAAEAITVRADRVFTGERFVSLPEARASRFAAEVCFAAASTPADLDAASARLAALSRAIREADAWASAYLERNLK